MIVVDKEADKRVESVSRRKQARYKEVKSLAALPLLHAIVRKIEEHKNSKGKGVSTMMDFHKEIPFLLPAFMKGTQVLEVRLYTGIHDVTSTGGSDIQTVVDIAAQNFTGFSALADVFSEYRVIEGRFEYTPQYPVEFGAISSGTTSGSNFHAVIIGAIDYASGTPYSTASIALANDTRKIFPCGKSKEWPVLFDWLPDQTWTPTSTANTNFAYLKLYSEPDLGCQASQIFGHVTGWLDFQFRLLHGV